MLDEPTENADRWLLTYADTITLLTAFILMIFAMSVVSRGKFSAMAASVRTGFNGNENGGPHILNGGGAHTHRHGPTKHDDPTPNFVAYQAAMRNIRDYVEQQKLSDRVSVSSDERGTVVSVLTDRMLFARGQATIAPGGAPVLDRLATALAKIPNRVEVEGHTCNLPMKSAAFASNWELSSARAGAVVRYFTEHARLSPERFAAAGYADTRPLAPNTNEANRTRNRRVEVVILKSRARTDGDALRQSELRRILVPEAVGQNGAAPDAGAATRPPDTQPSAPPATAPE